MRQQVNVTIVLDADAEINARSLRDYISDQISSIDSKTAEVMEITIQEEAEIFGND